MPKSTEKTEETKLGKEEPKAEESSAAETVEAEEESFIPEITNFNMVLISGFGIALLIIMIMLVNGSGESVEAALGSESPTPEATAVPDPERDSFATVVESGGIERKGEGRHFYTTIRIPPGAETLYLSGSGAGQMEDGT